MEEARGVYERDLDRNDSPYDQGYRAVLQGLIAQVDCEQGRPKDGLTRLEKVLPAHAHDVSERAFDHSVQASCLLQLGDLDGAEQAGRDGLAAAELAEQFEERLMNGLIFARVQAARGNRPGALQSLRALLREAESVGDLHAFEARLGLGEVEIQAGRPEGRSRLEHLERDARSRGFARIARLARAARERRPTLASPAIH
jgi:hypothetical protein